MFQTLTSETTSKVSVRLVDFNDCTTHITLNSAALLLLRHVIAFIVDTTTKSKSKLKVMCLNSSDSKCEYIWVRHKSNLTSIWDFFWFYSIFALACTIWNQHKWCPSARFVLPSLLPCPAVSDNLMRSLQGATLRGELEHCQPGRALSGNAGCLLALTVCRALT